MDFNLDQRSCERDGCVLMPNHSHLTDAEIECFRVFSEWHALEESSQRISQVCDRTHILRSFVWRRFRSIFVWKRFRGIHVLAAVLFLRALVISGDVKSSQPAWKSAMSVHRSFFCLSFVFPFVF